MNWAIMCNVFSPNTMNIENYSVVIGYWLKHNISYSIVQLACDFLHAPDCPWYTSNSNINAHIIISYKLKYYCSGAFTGLVIKWIRIDTSLFLTMTSSFTSINSLLRSTSAINQNTLWVGHRVNEKINFHSLISSTDPGIWEGPVIFEWCITFRQKVDRYCTLLMFYRNNSFPSISEKIWLPFPLNNYYYYTI